MRPIARLLPTVRNTALAGVIAGLAASAAFAQTAPRHFPSDEDLRTMLRYLVEDGETKGIVLGILEADGSRRILSYGSGGATARPLGPKSVFEMGSITKVFTGVLLADMVERGEVSLSDPVAKHLPTDVKVPSRNGREITLLDLATHRSALTRMPTNIPDTSSTRYPAYSIRDMYAFLSGHELRRDIGAEYEYSNIGVALLGHALGRAARSSYEELIRQRILGPLGMRMSNTVVDGPLVEWNTQGHDNRGVAPYRGWAELPAMGALRSNAEDMLAFLEANMGDPQSRLERVMRTAHEPRAATESEQADVGLNWRIMKLGNRRIITHGGNTAGYSTRIAFDPEKRVGFVELTNIASFGDDIALDFLRRGPPLTIVEVSVPKATLARYIGSYEMSPGRAMVVRLENEGYLTVQAPNNVRFKLYAESDTKFFTKRAPWRFSFVSNEAGAVTSLGVDLEGNVRTLPKVSDTGPPPAVVAGNASLDLPLTPEAMAAYAGTYEVQLGARTIDMRVYIENGQLMAHPSTASAPSRLLRQGDHDFRVAANLQFRIVFVVQGESAPTLTLYQGTTAFPGRRKP